MPCADAELTQDRFLGGALAIAQPRLGYRAGVDPVLLAAAVPAKAGQSVLELGCGAGVASLCLGRRVPGLRLAGVELQPDYAQLAHRNADTNAVPMQVFTADLRCLPPEVKAANFDHVIANPPYFSRANGTAAANQGREIALAGQTALADWIDAATLRLAPNGHLTLIQKTDRLGSVTILPLASRTGRAAELVIVQARKGGRAGLRLLAPVILHEGERHQRDGESYTPQIRAVLRDGAALTLAR